MRPHAFPMSIPAPIAAAIGSFQSNKPAVRRPAKSPHQSRRAPRPLLRRLRTQIIMHGLKQPVFVTWRIKYLSIISVVECRKLRRRASGVFATMLPGVHGQDIFCASEPTAPYGLPAKRLSIALRRTARTEQSRCPFTWTRTGRCPKVNPNVLRRVKHIPNFFK